MSVNEVKNNIVKLIEFKKVKLFALSLEFAGKAINIFRSRQGTEQGVKYIWTNQTNDAEKRMFSNAFIDGDEIGFFLSHGAAHGVYLELANDRKFEAIRPIMLELAPEFFKAVEELF